jgi:uncharacterized small protein (DUF1192 family)
MQESPTNKARDIACASATSWSPSSLLVDHQSSSGLSQETDADYVSTCINAVRKLDELPSYLKKLQRRVTEAETAKKLAELEVREYEERIRALQMENEHLKARQGF